MITPTEYGFSALSGACVILTMDSIDMGHPWLAVMSSVGFLIAVWLVRMQPTNVNDGLIVRRSALTVFAYVHDRPVIWCGTKHLHDMHVHSQQEPVNDTTLFVQERDVVCLGHECLCPEVHMQKVGQE